MKCYIKLLRVHHYIKNLLIFVPLFFNRSIFDFSNLLTSLWGFFSFSLIASAIYILNDIRDVEKDRNHPKKKMRPIASGKVSIRNAVYLLMCCTVAAVLIESVTLHMKGTWCLALYFGLNVAYSVKLKKYPIIDIVILASGFVIRILYGGVISDVPISSWLYLVIVAGSLFMGLGKRRNEMKQQGNTREVLKYYNEGFLDKNMYVSMALVIVFYALWAVESLNALMIWTVPVVIVILMKYSYNIEGNSDGDPVDVLFHDRVLVMLCAIYAALMFVMLYL